MMPHWGFLLLALIAAILLPAAQAEGPWKVERVWEKIPVQSRYNPDEAWPLWLPKRTEKTILFKITLGGGSERSDGSVPVVIEDEFYCEATVPSATIVPLGDDEQHDSRILSSEGESDPHSSEESGGTIHVIYEDIYDTLVFLATTWVAGRIALWLGMPTLVGEIVTGFLLGPPLADFVPQVRRNCLQQTRAWCRARMCLVRWSVTQLQLQFFDSFL